MATWQHLRSSTANKRPTTSLADGRIAINTNTASPGLFFKDSAGTGIVKVGPVHVGTTAPNSVPAAGGSSGNYTGEQWLDTSVSPAQMKVWNGSTWVGIVADELPVSKLQDGAARQLIQTDAAGTGVEWTSDVDVPGTLDVTSTATFDSIAQHPLGTAGAPTITFTGDNNTGIYSPGADQVAISTGGTGRLFVDASGNVGIGNNAPLLAAGYTSLRLNGSTGGLLELTSAATRVLQIQSLGAAGGAQITTIDNGSSPPLIFGTNSVERLRITSAGLVGVGTSTVDRGGLHVANYVQQGTSTPYDNYAWLGPVYNNFGTGASNPATILVGSLNSTKDSAIIFAGGDFAGGMGSGWAIRHAKSNGAGSLAFSTHGGTGAGGETERVRIDSSGRVGIGTTSPNAILETSATATGNTVGALLTNRNQSGSADSVSINFGLGRSVDTLYFSCPAIQYVKEQQWTGTASTIDASLVFATTRDESTTEKARIDSSGRLLIGTSSAQGGNPLQVESAGGGIFLRRNLPNGSLSDGNGLGLIDFGNQSGGIGARIEAVADGGWGAGGNDYPSRLVFSTTADGASSPTERLRITSTGQVRLAGAGITFNGDTATANELDDYEEGGWTPTLGGTATYVNRNGYYTKIGRLVHVTCGLYVDQIGTGSTQFISGLPFAVSGGGAINQTGCVSRVTNSNVNLTSALVYCGDGGGTGVAFGGFTAASSGTSLDVAIFKNGTQINFSFTYSI